MFRNYHEDDRELKIPKRYLKWSDKKIDRVIKRMEFLARIKNRLIPTRKTPDVGFEVYWEGKSDDKDSGNCKEVVIPKGTMRRFSRQEIYDILDESSRQVKEGKHRPVDESLEGLGRKYGILEEKAHDKNRN